MLKKILVTAGIIFLIVLVIIGIFIARVTTMAHSIEEKASLAPNIDLKQIKDGVYVGSFGEFVNFASVEVTVKKHKIEKIIIKEQESGSGYEARETVDRILKAQSPKVDAVTGASSSSRCIMLAVDKALTQKPAKK